MRDRLITYLGTLEPEESDAPVYKAVAIYRQELEARRVKVFVDVLNNNVSVETVQSIG